MHRFLSVSLFLSCAREGYPFQRIQQRYGVPCGVFAQVFRRTIFEERWGWRRHLTDSILSFKKAYGCFTIIFEDVLVHFSYWFIKRIFATA